MITETKRPNRLDSNNATDANRITSIAAAPSPVEWAEKHRRIAELKRELKTLEAEVAPLNDRILSKMRDQGRMEAKFAGVSVKRKVTDSVTRRDGCTADSVMDVLRQIGHGDLVSENYSPGGVKALVLKDKEILPPELLDLFDVGEREDLLISL